MSTRSAFSLSVLKKAFVCQNITYRGDGYITSYVVSKKHDDLLKENRICDPFLTSAVFAFKDITHNHG